MWVVLVMCCSLVLSVEALLPGFDSNLACNIYIYQFIYYRLHTFLIAGTIVEV